MVAAAHACVVAGTAKAAVGSCTEGWVTAAAGQASATVGGDCDCGLSARTNGGLGNGRGGKSESGDGQGEGREA